jgi:hypothetical protein
MLDSLVRVSRRVRWATDRKHRAIYTDDAARRQDTPANAINGHCRAVPARPGRERRAHANAPVHRYKKSAPERPSYTEAITPAVWRPRATFFRDEAAPAGQLLAAHAKSPQSAPNRQTHRHRHTPNRRDGLSANSRIYPARVNRGPRDTRGPIRLALDGFTYS